MSEQGSKTSRIDQLLVTRGLVPTRHKAEALILAGEVLIDDTPIEKPGRRVPVNSEIRLRSNRKRYVGRGGDKLEAALDQFSVHVDGVVAVDVGASTGGFTDCLLQHGACKVYTVDVGYNQLDLRLRQDNRVVVMERVNAKSLDENSFNPRPALAVIDVSFIGLRKILPSVVKALANPYQIIALVKPQFELGREYVSKGGVVREEKDQLLAVELVAEEARRLGLNMLGSLASPIRGGKKKNQEFFVCLTS